MSAIVLQELFRTRTLDPDYRPEFELPIEAVEEFPYNMLILLITIVLLIVVSLILAIKFVSYKKKYDLLKKSPKTDSMEYWLTSLPEMFYIKAE